MPRAIWKGSLSFGLVNIPVALYSAENRSDELSFHLLDRRDMAPVGYKRVNRQTSEDVPWDEIVKGFEYEPGRYVVVTDEDFIRADVEATRTVAIVDFVDGRAIDPAYYEKPYYLAPANSGAEKGYALLCETLKRTGKVGIAKVVMRTREYLAAVSSRGPVMLLEVLRFAHELRDPEEVQVPGDDPARVGVSDEELRLAASLVEQMVTEWKPERYRDGYREDVLALIRRKVERGEAMEVVEAVHGPEDVAPAPDTVDIMTLLRKSVAERTKAAPSAERGGRGVAGTRGANRKTA